MKVVSLCLILATVFAAFGLWLFRDLELVRENKILSRLADVSITETQSMQMRLLSWRSALQGFNEHPVFGWGHNNVYYVLNKYYNPQHVRFDLGFRGSEATWWDKSHNSYIDLLIEKGVVGYFLYLGIFIALARDLWFTRTGSLSYCLAGGFLAYGLSNLVAFDSFGSLFSCSLFLGLAATIALSDRANSLPQWGRSISDDPKRKRKPVVRVASATSLGMGAILTIALVGLYLNLESARASVKYNRARLLFQSNPAYSLSLYKEAFTHFSPYSPREKLNCAYLTINGLITGKLDSRTGASADYALELAADSEVALQRDPLVHMVLNEIFNGLALYVDDKYLAQAEAAGKRALEYSPQRQEIMFTLGRTYILANQPEKAADLNRRMIQQFPDLPVAHWLLGLSLLAMNERDEAKQEIETAIAMGYRLRSQKERSTVETLFGEKEFTQLMRRYK